MKIFYEETVSKERLSQIETLFQSLGGFNNAIFRNTISKNEGLLCCYAEVNDQIVACKIGYSPRPKYFESWIGGVLENIEKK